MAPNYAFYTIYLQEYGYSKTTIGVLWGLGVVAEVISSSSCTACCAASPVASSSW